MPATTKAQVFMGSLGLIALGMACLVATFLLLQRVRPRADRPAPAWAQADTASTLLALLMVIGSVFGIALIIAGALG